MKINTAHQKIINTIIEKAERDCPGSLALIAVYGSVRTGDLHDKSDLDLLVLINDEAARPLSDCFILDNLNVGYDIYCTTWQMLEIDAFCRHAKLSRLMDSEIIYAPDDKAVEKLRELQSKAGEMLNSPKRHEQTRIIIADAKKLYADVMLADTIGRARTTASTCINLILDAAMLENGTYFRKGVKRTFEELEGLYLPEGFTDRILDIAGASEISAIKRHLTELLKSVLSFFQGKNEKEEPSKENIAGTYEEMFSNWRNKMDEALVRHDSYSSFINLASLQHMLEEISHDLSITPIDVMEYYDPSDLHKNLEVFDDALNKYLDEYEKAGIEVRRFADVEAFVETYLSPKS